MTSLLASALRANGDVPEKRKNSGESFKERKMLNERYRFLFVIGLVLTLGLTTTFANDGDKANRKRLKTEGILSIKSSPAAYPVRIDGQEVGLTGVGEGREYYLTPGIHQVEVLGPDGQVAWRDEVTIRRGMRNCICVKAVEETTTKPCPYRFHLEGPAEVSEGDLVTFTAVPDVQSPIPLTFAWTVDRGTITSGLGTPTITVDSRGMGSQTINAELDVNDGVYDNRCRQTISLPTEVEAPPPVVPTPTAFACDEFISRSADDDKARFDNCVIQVQNAPDSKLYIVIYPGTDKLSRTRNTYERLSKRALDYIVRTRGLDPTRVQFIKGSPRDRTTYKMWVVPPGAQLPPID